MDTLVRSIDAIIANPINLTLPVFFLVMAVVIAFGGPKKKRETFAVAEEKKPFTVVPPKAVQNTFWASDDKSPVAPNCTWEIMLPVIGVLVCLCFVGVGISNSEAGNGRSVNTSSSDYQTAYRGAVNSRNLGNSMSDTFWAHRQAADITGNPFSSEKRQAIRDAYGR